MRNRAQIICIGDELLIGQVVNTNSAWLGSKLTELGFNVTKNIVISDNYNEIYNFKEERLKLEKEGFQNVDSGLEWVAKDEIEISQGDQKKLEALFEALDENDDVQAIYSNTK